MILKIKHFEDFKKLVENSNLVVFYREITFDIGEESPKRRFELFLVENGAVYSTDVFLEEERNIEDLFPEMIILQ